MIKEIRVPDERFLDYFEWLTLKIENIEAEKEAEIQELIKPIDEKYATRLDTFKTALDEVSKIEVVEVPDEETVEENNEEFGG